MSPPCGGLRTPPQGGTPTGIGGTEEADRLRLITLTAEQLESVEQLLLQRPAGRPFFVDIPAATPQRIISLPPYAAPFTRTGAGWKKMEEADRTCP